MQRNFEGLNSEFLGFKQSWFTLLVVYITCSLWGEGGGKGIRGCPMPNPQTEGPSAAFHLTSTLKHALHGWTCRGYNSCQYYPQGHRCTRAYSPYCYFAILDHFKMIFKSCSDFIHWYLTVSSVSKSPGVIFHHVCISSLRGLWHWEHHQVDSVGRAADCIVHRHPVDKVRHQGSDTFGCHFLISCCKNGLLYGFVSNYDWTAGIRKPGVDKGENRKQLKRWSR